MTDTTLVFIICCFLSTHALQLQEVDKQPLGDSSSEFLQPFCSVRETEGLFVGVPQVLNDPVKNCVEHANETGVWLIGDCMPIQLLLAGHLHSSVPEYRDSIVKWMFEN